ncbi:hypothetical protein [Halanaeroarchaeum sp. HSR-CO]|uniref:hypothetical protein n=1 Tax=Halanaeroarchaeum sp. HSR-CO TaxID=2866382 RepID=UPI00217D8104|nr:hypothetical protein [Halanaeroarchaeum sp. HSR-CO]
MARPGEHAEEARERADDALTAALANRTTEPECEACSSPADFFLYEPERVATFVCWEHVSPVAAVVDADRPTDRPLAVPLSEEFS